MGILLSAHTQRPVAAQDVQRVQVSWSRRLDAGFKPLVARHCMGQGGCIGDSRHFARDQERRKASQGSKYIEHNYGRSDLVDIVQWLGLS